MSQTTVNYTGNSLCSECHQATSFQQAVVLGKNSVDVTCSHCGERWHINFQVLSLDPLLVGDVLVKRLVGVTQGNTFFPKDQLQ